MEIKLNIEPINPPPRTLADVPSRVLCIGEDGDWYYRSCNATYTFTRGINKSLVWKRRLSPRGINITEILGPCRMDVTGTGRDRKFELVVDWPEESEQRTLADVDEGVACRDQNGRIVWREHSNVMQCIQGTFPCYVPSRVPSEVRVWQILGRISITWEPE